MLNFDRQWCHSLIPIESSFLHRMLRLLGADCSIIASRLQVNLDDLLWVLTNSQLKAAVTFVGSLRDVVARSTEQSKRLAAEKLRVS